MANDGEGWRYHSLWHKGLSSCSACFIARGTLGSAAEGKNQPRGGSLQAAETPTQVLCLRSTKHVVWCFEDPALFRIRPQSWCELQPGRCSAMLQLLPFKSAQSFSTSPFTLALVTPLIFLRSLKEKNTSLSLFWPVGSLHALFCSSSGEAVLLPGAWDSWFVNPSNAL